VKFNVGLGCALACLALAGCNRDQGAAAGGGGGKSSKSQLTKLGIEDVKVGTGDPAKVGDMVYMEYRGTLASGIEFDSNVPADPKNPDKAPFMFQLTNGQPTVIEGWNKGILGMKVGGERKLSIPYELAYGDKSQGPLIGPKTDLYFDVKLLYVIRPGHESDYGVTDIKQGSGRGVKKGDWVTITYTARLLNDLLVVDSKATPPGTLQFQAGTGELGGNNFVPITGVVDGVIGMKEGGERLLTLPPSLANNPMWHDDRVPAGSVIRFDVQLLRVSDKQGPTITVAPDASTKKP